MFSRLRSLKALRAAARPAPAAGARSASSAHGGQMHWHVSKWHKNAGTAGGVVLWTWVFWRIYQDGAALLGYHPPEDKPLESGEAYFQPELGEAPQQVRFHTAETLAFSLNDDEEA